MTITMLRRAAHPLLLARRAAVSSAITGRRTVLCALECARWMSTDTTASDEDKGEASLLPKHIKFRMPDLDFEHISGGSSSVTLSKWHAKEGQRIVDGTHMCEIDTPDLVFVLDSGDEGYLARILVASDTSNVPPGQPLAIIVPTEDDVALFVEALKQHPKAIEGYVEPVDASVVESSSSSPSTASSPSEHAPPSSAASDADGNSDGAAVLRLLHKLHKDGHFEDEKLFKVLKSLARKNDTQLLVTYKGSFDGDKDTDATGETFDVSFFVETAVELAEEALANQSTTSK